MDKYSRDIFIEYKPSIETFEAALKLTEKLGKLNIRMKDTFWDYKIPSRLFAFIESKFSSKIEGIYTTLFDVVNTGTKTKQEKVIKPLVEALIREDKLIDQAKIDSLAKALNEGKDKQKRYSENFGIWNHKTNTKIYEPLLTQKEIDNELQFFWKMTNSTETNVIKAISSHIFFEKIHPYFDGNGRIGRLILNRKLSEVTNFSNILPFSWAIYKNRDKYYDAFMFGNSKCLEKGIRATIDIMLFMYKKVKGFLKDLNAYYDKYKETVMNSSARMTKEMCRSILFTLQTKQSFLIRNYQLNSRTVNNIFEKIGATMDFNAKIHGREKLYWNIEIETIIDKWFGE